MGITNLCGPPVEMERVREGSRDVRDVLRQWGQEGRIRRGEGRDTIPCCQITLAVQDDEDGLLIPSQGPQKEGRMPSSQVTAQEATYSIYPRRGSSLFLLYPGPLGVHVCPQSVHRPSAFHRSWPKVLCHMLFFPPFGEVLEVFCWLKGSSCLIVHLSLDVLFVFL